MSEPRTTDEPIDAAPLERALEDDVKRDILAALVATAGEQRNPSQIASAAGIDLETFYDHIPALEESGLVVYTYIVGNGPVYEVDRVNLASALEALA